MPLLQTARERILLNRALGPAAIREVERSGTVERVARGVYLRTDPGWEAWQRARVVNLARTIAELQREVGARACLTSAALLWDLPVWQFPTNVDIFTPRATWRRPVKLPMVSSLTKPRPETMRRHAYKVDDKDLAVVDGVPTTTLERLALDIALHWHPRDALVTVDSIFRRIVVPERADRFGTDARTEGLRIELNDRLEALGPQRGIQRARAVIAWATARCESPGESVVRWAALALGLPEPICQYMFTRSNGRCFYLDLFWSGFNVGIEFDGVMKYRGDQGVDVVVAEKARDDEIRRSGIHVVHLDTATANRTLALASTLRSELPNAMWAKAQQRTGLTTLELSRWALLAERGSAA